MKKSEVIRFKEQLGGSHSEGFYFCVNTVVFSCCFFLQKALEKVSKWALSEAQLSNLDLVFLKFYVHILCFPDLS